MGPVPNGRNLWLINRGDPITTYKSWDDPPNRCFFDQPFLVNLPRIPRTRMKIFVWVDSLTKPPVGAVNGRYYLTSHLKKILAFSQIMDHQPEVFWVKISLKKIFEASPPRS